jgi:hypothetical protein
MNSQMRFIYLIIIFLQTSIEEGNGCAGATLYQTEYATAIATGIIALALEAKYVLLLCG